MATEKNIQHQDHYGIAGKVAMVTGGSKNIGRSITLALVKAGVVPIMLVRNDRETADTLAAEIREQGSRAGVYVADLADVTALQAVVKAAESEFGGIDILINNAAIRPNTKISGVTVEEWDRVIATNLRAPFFLSQAVLPGMVRRKWGRIINLGGLDAYWGKPRRPHNVSAKLGLVGQSRALANEVARFGITVNMIVPGTTDTYRHSPEWYPEIERLYDERKQRIPMGRLGTSEEVANACVFFASALASYTTGQELLVTGGASPLVRQPADEYDAADF